MVPTRTLQLRLTTATEPQARFWRSDRRFRAFVGGIGSGKTRAGAVEVLRQPGGSRGVVAAPTYPMLRDETQRTLLALCKRLGVLAPGGYHASESRAILINGTEILFRSADDPDRLRGPNLGWFWLDEGAYVGLGVWDVLIGRLRREPGRGWVTTTPAGLNWAWERFVRDATPDYAVIHSTTAQNQYLPDGYLESLRSSYTAEYARQELGGEFVEAGRSMFRREWFRVEERAPDGLRWARFWDLAASTKASADYTASIRAALAPDGRLWLAGGIRGRWEWPDARKVILATAAAEPGTAIGIEAVAYQLAAVQDLQREASLVAADVRGVPVDRDKVSRALPWAARAEAGKVALERGEWIREWLDEVCSFPAGAHDDQVDATSGAVGLLAVRPPPPAGGIMGADAHTATRRHPARLFGREL